uniref:LamG-like jellyroll fold domain-containing protein n=1 Tax=viral metagenome TaxID=1070528 RepID=A0A6C0KL10_9ZZZZ
MDQNSMNNVSNNISNTANNTLQGVGNFFLNMKNNISSGLNSFSQEPGATSQYTYSNSMIAKFAFLILIVIIFMFLLSLGISLVSYFTLPSNDPYVVKGMIDGNFPLRISQDPNNSSAVPILKSNNQSSGAEFTWSTWIYLNDLGTDDKYRHIFTKGDGIFDDKNMSTVNNAPGLYLTPKKNELLVIMNTVSPENVNETIKIDNIPIKKWVNVMIRLQNIYLDVYINGTVTKRVVLKNVPKQNYNDVYVNQNGGFPGKLADLRYFSRALNIFEINTIMMGGPNTRTSTLYASQTSKGGYSYLSNMWYSSKM